MAKRVSGTSGYARGGNPRVSRAINSRVRVDPSLSRPAPSARCLQDRMQRRIMLLY